MKILTVIVPAYDMEAFLPACCGSLLLQTDAIQSLQVIVVNDGSHDGTLSVARGFANRFPGVFSVIDKGNGHYGSCVNAALSRAEGRYVKILDADDRFESGNLGAFIEFLRGTDADLVLSDYLIEDSRGVAGEVRYPFATGRPFPFSDFVAGDPQMAMHAVAYRTGLLKEQGYRQMEGVPYTDTEWFFSPMRGVRTVAYFQQIVYRYRLGREGQSMAPAVFARNMPLLISVFKRLVGFYRSAERTFDDAHRRYFLSQLERTADTIADTYLDLAPLSALWRDYPVFDAYLQRQVPEVDFQTPRVSLFRHSRCPFYYALFWRRYPRLRIPCVLFLRAYRRLTGCVDRLSRRLRAQEQVEERE